MIYSATEGGSISRVVLGRAVLLRAVGLRWVDSWGLRGDCGGRRRKAARRSGRHPSNPFDRD